MTDDPPSDEPPSERDGTSAAPSQHGPHEGAEQRRGHDDESEARATRERSSSPPSSSHLRAVAAETTEPRMAADGDDEDPPVVAGERGPGLSADAIAEICCRPEVQKQLFKRVYDAIKGQYRRQEAKDFVADICVACIASRTPPATEAVAVGWIHTVATNTLREINKKHFRRAPHQAKWDQERVEAVAEPWREDEVVVQKWMLLPWALEQVVGDSFGAETLWIIRYKARSGMTWAALAQERNRGETADQLKKRVQRFGTEHGPARKKYLLLMGLVVTLLLGTVLALAAVIWWVIAPAAPALQPLPPAPLVRPDVPDAFLQALPTQPEPTADKPAPSATPAPSAKAPPRNRPAPRGAPNDKGPGNDKGP